MSEQDSLFKEPAPGNSPAEPASSYPTHGSTQGSADPDLAAELRIAQRQISNLMLILLVVSGTLAIYLLQQVRYIRADLAIVEPQQQNLQQARQAIASYNKTSVPAMQNFIQQLGDYSQTHPDIVPILVKYGFARPTSAPTGAAPPQNP